MNRGVNRQQIFFGDSGRVEFEQRLTAMHDKFNVRTLAFALMGNHYHLVLHADEGMLSPAMGQCMSGFVRHTNDRLNRDGPLFRGRFHSIPIETERYLLTATRYTHLNPLDIRSVTSLPEYRWCSYGAYLGRRPRPSFLDVDPVLGLFGNDIGSFARFTAGDSSMLQQFPVTADDVRMLAAGAVAMQISSGQLDDAERGSLERCISVALLDEQLTVEARAAVEALLGDVHSGAVRTARSRARRRLANEPALRAMVDLVAENLGGLRLAA